ncbi:MAG: hypothetical protein AB1553_11410 [Nitrospirota bacterium]
MRPLPDTLCDPGSAMAIKRRISGSVIGIIGYLLSPLSWWNDLFLNIPLAYACAWLVSLVYKPAFLSSFVISYWITNIAGLVIMHKGIEKIVKKGNGDTHYTKRQFLKDLAVSLAYTGLIMLLVKLGMIRPIGDYI